MRLTPTFAINFALAASVCLGPCWSDEQERIELVAAAEALASSIVRIDRVAAQGASGDLFDGAPVSGIVVSAEGFVITSRLSVEGNPAGLLVTTSSGARFGAKLVAEDRSRELALLQLDGAKDLKPVQLEDCGPLPLGLGVAAVGCPMETESATLSLGIISGSGRLWGRALQTDARVSLGQLGGGLVDRRGRLLGVLIPAAGEDMAGETGTDWYDSGVTMVVPAGDLLKRMERLKSGKTIRAGLMGLSWSALFTNGTEVAGVHPGSPAARGGLRSGDQIVSIEGQAIERMDQVRQVLGRFDAGDQVTLVVRRANQELSITTQLIDELPPFRPAVLGFWCSAEETGLRISSILPGSPAAEAKLVVGDLITKVGGEALREPQDLVLAINLLGNDVPLNLTLSDDRQIELLPRPITGALPTDLPPLGPTEKTWEWHEIVLPELPNKVSYWGPRETAKGNPMGLVVIAAGLENKNLQSDVEAWSAAAVDEGVSLAVVSPRDNERWQRDEAEVLARVARQIARKWNIDQRRVAVTGVGPGASLALAAAFSQRETFRGVVSLLDTKLPKIRLLANDPAECVQVLWLGGEDYPPWLTALKRAGYAVRHAEKSELSSVEGGRSLLRWNRLLGLL